MDKPMTINLPIDTSPDDLPEGWEFGAHWSENGCQGWYLIHGSKPSIRALERPDLSLVDHPLDSHTMTREAFRGQF